MQVLIQEKYMYLFLTNFVLGFVNIPKRYEVIKEVLTAG
jgi:hypothetical protein